MKISKSVARILIIEVYLHRISFFIFFSTFPTHVDKMLKSYCAKTTAGSESTV